MYSVTQLGIGLRSVDTVQYVVRRDVAVTHSGHVHADM